MSEPDERPSPRRPHVLGDLGLVIAPAGDDLHGRADVVDNMLTPGTGALRMSVLVSWADTLLGLLAMRTITPRMPVTLELAVDLYEPIPSGIAVRSVGRVLKAGTSVVVLAIEFTDDAGRPLGVGHSSFMAAPDPGLSMPVGNWALDRFNSQRGTLDEPFADRVGCTRLGPGVASMPCDPALLNTSKTLNGGLVSVVIEEAALSDVEDHSIASMALRYLRPVRVGPAVARAVRHGTASIVEVHDDATGTLAIAATTRCFGG